MHRYPTVQHYAVFFDVNGVRSTVDYRGEKRTTCSPGQHYAFLISDPEFDEIFGRIQERELPYWADPGQEQGQDQPPRRRARRLFRGPERPPARDHHPPLRQRRLESVATGSADRFIARHDCSRHHGNEAPASKPRGLFCQVHHADRGNSYVAAKGTEIDNGERAGVPTDLAEKLHWSGRTASFGRRTRSCARRRLILRWRS